MNSQDSEKQDVGEAGHRVAIAENDTQADGQLVREAVANGVAPLGDGVQLGEQFSSEAAPSNVTISENDTQADRQHPSEGAAQEDQDDGKATPNVAIAEPDPEQQGPGVAITKSDSENQDISGTEPSVVIAEQNTQAEEALPVAVADGSVDELGQSSEKAERWRRASEHEQEAENEQQTESEQQRQLHPMREAYMSALSDSSDENATQSPAPPPQQDKEDLELWSDDDEERPPPPRPATPLAPSVTQDKLDKFPLPPQLHDDTELGDIVRSKRINNHKQRRDQRDNIPQMPDYQTKKKMKWTLGKSSMSLAIQPSEESSPGFAFRNTDSRGPYDPAGVHLPDSPDIDRTCIEGEEEHQNDQPDSWVQYFDSDHSPRSSGNGKNGDDSHAVDSENELGARTKCGLADGRREGYESIAPLDDTSPQSPGAEQTRPEATGEETDNAGHEKDRSTTPEPQDQIPRPGSPITGLYEDEDIPDYYSQEFDSLTGCNIAGPEGLSYSQDQLGGESFETPPTPNSAEVLEQVTGMSLEEGEQKFKRLTELAETPVMQNPQRALEMKRQMFMYLSGRHNISQLGPKGAKNTAKAKAAWASAAAHHYRHQRNDLEKECDDWKRYARAQCDLAQGLENDIHGWKRTCKNGNESYLQLQESYFKLQEALESTKEEKADAETARDFANETLQQAQRERDAFRTALEAAHGERDALDSSDPEIDGDRPPTTEQIAPAHQGEKLLDLEDAETQAGPKTDSPATSDNKPMNSIEEGIEEGRQTDPEQTSDTTPVGFTAFESLLNPGAIVLPRLRFAIDSDVRTRLVPEIVRWINASHQRLQGDPLAPAVTNERIEKLLADETTYDDFVSVLRTDETRFRPDHLADHIERYINENSLGRIPLAIVQFQYPIDQRQLLANTNAVYDQIAKRQVAINYLEGLERRASSMEVAPLNANRQAVLILQGSLAEADGEIQQARDQTTDANRQLGRLQNQLAENKQIFAQVTGRIDDLESHNRQLQGERDILQTELAESQRTVNELTRSISQKSHSSEDSKAPGKETEQLKSQLHACREHGGQLQKSLDDADSEKETLRVSLRGCHRHGEGLKADNDRLSEEAADWKKQLQDIQQRGRDEVAQLQAEIQRVKSENKRLNVTQTRPSDEEEDLELLVVGLETENERLTKSNARLTDESQGLSNLQAEQEKRATGDINAGTAAEFTALKEENAELAGENKRYNQLLNWLRAQNLKAEAATQNPAPITTDLPLRAPRDTARGKILSKPSAIPLPPVTPAFTIDAALPAGNSPLRPTEVNTSRKRALPLPPINAETMPARWLERERRIQKTTAFWETRAKVVKMLEERDAEWEKMRGQGRHWATREAERKMREVLVS